MEDREAQEVKIQRTIIVAGNYRCGTTWLAEMLATGLPDYALMFEPIRAYFSNMRFAKITNWRPYITAESATVRERVVFRDVLSGEMCRYEKLEHTDAEHVLQSSSIVVKFVRGLMSLRWMCDTFNIRHCFVIMRHPCAAAASQFRIKAERGTPTRLEELDVFFELHPEIERFRPKSYAEWFTLWWAASYYAALSTPEPHPWTLLKYEDLCRRPGIVEEVVFDPLGTLPIVPTLQLVQRLSVTARKWSSGGPTPWRNYLGDRAQEIWGVVERFPGLTEFYDAP